MISELLSIEFDVVKENRKYYSRERNGRVREVHKERMIKLVLDSEPDGLSTPELSKEMKCHPDTVLKIGKELIRERKLVPKNGRFGKYHVTKEVYRDPTYIAQDLMYELLYKPAFRSPFRNQYLCIDDSFSNETLSERLDFLLSQDRSYFNVPQNRSEMDSILTHEFASRIGAIITYLIILPFQFNRNSPSHSLNTVRGQLENKEANPSLGPEQNRYPEQLEGRRVDKLIIDWINNAIQPTTILIEFIRFMNNAGRSIYGEDILRRDKNDSNLQQRSFYEINSEDYHRLKCAYARSYPKLFDLIEEIRNNELPDKIAKKVAWTNEQLGERLCRPHDFFIRKTSNGYEHFECSNCHTTRDIRRSQIVTNRDLATKLHKHSKYPGGSPKRGKNKCAPKNHVWIRNASAHQDMSENMFECLRCSKWYTLPADSKDKLEKIRQSIPARFKTHNGINFCRLIQKFFYKFSNEEHSINDLLESIEENSEIGLLNRRREHGRQEFTPPMIRKQICEIIDFLVEYQFLSHGTSISESQSDDPLMVPYIHRNQMNWK
jgi:hypothetical protein